MRNMINMKRCLRTATRSPESKDFWMPANAMASETASVYAEIGFLAGILLARDVDRRVGIDSM